MIWLPRIFEQLRAAECITSFACVESLAVSNHPASGKSTGVCWMLGWLDFRNASFALCQPLPVYPNQRTSPYRPRLVRFVPMD